MLDENKSILVADVLVGERIRTEHGNLESLAESITDSGLIQPIVLSPKDGKFELNAGGRRLGACKLLGITRLYHGLTSFPGHAGYVLKEEAEADELRNLITEISENQDRDDLPWKDKMRALVRAHTLATHQAALKGQEITMRQLGYELGVGYQDVRTAMLVYQDVEENPERYSDVVTIRQAYAKMLQLNAEHIAKELALRKSAPVSVEVQENPNEVSKPTQVPPTFIDLSSFFHNANSLDYAYNFSNASVDHIVTDPDYAIAKEVLESNMNDVSKGIAQASSVDSLSDLELLITTAWRVLKSHGFLVFFYDLDHHEKLQAMATSIGFKVQRWPIIWHKTDYRSNGAPSHNFCKNIEYAMVCRKPGAVLAATQMSSIYSGPSGVVTKMLGHPFAKPFGLWKFIYSSIASPGQTVWDPFIGSGSSAIPAYELGLQPSGCEIQESNYHALLSNLKSFHMGRTPNVKFI